MKTPHSYRNTSPVHCLHHWPTVVLIARSLPFQILNHGLVLLFGAKLDKLNPSTKIRVYFGELTRSIKTPRHITTVPSFTVMNRLQKNWKDCTFKTHFELSLYKARDKQCWHPAFPLKLVWNRCEIANEFAYSAGGMPACLSRFTRVVARVPVSVRPEHRPNLPLVYLVYYVRENV